MVFATLSSVRPRPACSTFEARNTKAMEMNCFRSKLLSSEVFSASKLDVDDFAEQLQQCIAGVLDKLALHVLSRRATITCASYVKDAANTIACSVVGSRLKYVCNAIFYEMTESNLNRL